MLLAKIQANMLLARMRDTVSIVTAPRGGTSDTQMATGGLLAAHTALLSKDLQ